MTLRRVGKTASIASCDRLPQAIAIGLIERSKVLPALDERLSAIVVLDIKINFGVHGLGFALCVKHLIEIGFAGSQLVHQSGTLIRFFLENIIVGH